MQVARKWRFARSATDVFRKGNGETLPNADVRDLGAALQDKGYRVFLRDGALYGFKGLAGRLAPIGVHVSLLAIMAGAAVGAVAGLDGIVMVPQGTSFLVADVMRGSLPVGFPLPDGAGEVITVNRFSIDYAPDGSISQYRTQLVRTDLDGNPTGAKEIYVNMPMSFGGITVFQVRQGSVARCSLCGVNAPGKLLFLTSCGGSRAWATRAARHAARGGALSQLSPSFVLRPRRVGAPIAVAKILQTLTNLQTFTHLLWGGQRAPKRAVLSRVLFHSTDDQGWLQTDWGMAAMTVRSPASPLSPEGGAPYNVALTELSNVLGMNAKSKLYGAYVPVEQVDGTSKPKGVTGSWPL